MWGVFVYYIIRIPPDGDSLQAGPDLRRNGQMRTDSATSRCCAAALLPSFFRAGLADRLWSRTLIVLE